MSEELNPCCCGSANLKELKPYGVESVQCQECHVSLRKQDWNRVMRGALVREFKVSDYIDSKETATEYLREALSDGDLDFLKQAVAELGYALAPVGDLEKLRRSITGDEYMGTKWELDTVGAMIAAAKEEV